MSTIFSFILTTADGYHTGPNDEFDWPNVDAEFNEFAARQLDEIGTLLFGRATYEGMAAYWPTPMARDDDPVITAKMNATPKIVVSRTLERADWAGTRLVRENVAEEIAALKRRPGKAIAVFGSSMLTTYLIEQGLVDELRVMVNPIVLGAGKSPFRTAGRRIHLELLATRPFASGNVLLTYRPVAR